jgi:hypothetical protein
VGQALKSSDYGKCGWSIKPVSGTAPYYAEAFSPLPGRCFRLVARGGQRAGPLPGAARLARLLAGPERPPLPGQGLRGPPATRRPLSHPSATAPPSPGWAVRMAGERSHGRRCPDP